MMMKEEEEDEQVLDTQEGKTSMWGLNVYFFQINYSQDEEKNLITEWVHKINQSSRCFNFFPQCV